MAHCSAIRRRSWTIRRAKSKLLAETSTQSVHICENQAALIGQKVCATITGHVSQFWRLNNIPSAPITVETLSHRDNVSTINLWKTHGIQAIARR